MLAPVHLLLVAAAAGQLQATPPSSMHEQLLRAVAPSIVSLEVESRYDGLLEDLGRLLTSDDIDVVSGGATSDEVHRHAGTAIVFDNAGHIVTTASFATPGERFRAQLADGSVVTATLIGVDLVTDIAVLRLQGVALPAAKLQADPTTLVQGMTVCVVTAGSGAHCSVADGTLQALELNPGTGRHHDFLQLEFEPSPGAAGAAVVNARGEVIGIVAARREGGGTVAIPVATLAPVAQSLIDSGSVRRAWFGVTVRCAKNNHGRGGVDVYGIVETGPAKAAKLEPGDRILEFGDETIEDSGHLHRLVSESAPGQTVRLLVERRGRRRVLSVTLGEQHGSLRPGELAIRVYQTYLGAWAERAPGGTGVIIQSVVDESPALAAGLQAGDLLLKVAGQPVATPADLRRLVREQRPGEQVALTVRRGETTFDLRANLVAQARQIVLPGPQLELAPAELDRLAEDQPSTPNQQRDRPYLRTIRDEMTRSLVPR